MEGFIGEIRIFAGNFAPRSWAFCEGQLMAISQNSALFSILGTVYGGDGRTTFGLPDLRGRVPVGQGDGPGLTSRPLGQKGGAYQNTLNSTQIPSHNHSATAHTTNSSLAFSPEGAFPGSVAGRSLGSPPASIQATAYGSSSDTTLNSGALTLSATGGNSPMDNMQPSIAIYYIIAMYGIYPSRS